MDGSVYIENIFIVYILITIVILPSPVFSDHGRIESGHTMCLWLEMFEISPVSFQKHPQNGNK